ncbi:MAG TPA: hypothetical protein VJ302_13410 [Blastocatellia bacterium]|nr:hypothetical protein [Blastocatellia bacterium]
MWKKKRPHIDHEKLDRIGEELLHVIEASEAEINLAAASPFLYRRILARIDSERRRRSEEWNRWLAMLKEAKLAIPVFAIVVIVVMSFVWRAPEPVVQTPALNSRSSSQLMLTSEILPASNDEMIISVIGWEEQSANRSHER